MDKAALANAGLISRVARAAAYRQSYFFGNPGGFSSDFVIASEESPQRSRIFPYVPFLISTFSAACAATASPLPFLVVKAMSAFSGQPPLTVPTCLVLPSFAALYAAPAFGPKVRSARPDWIASDEAESSS